MILWHMGNLKNMESSFRPHHKLKSIGDSQGASNIQWRIFYQENQCEMKMFFFIVFIAIASDIVQYWCKISFPIQFLFTLFAQLSFGMRVCIAISYRSGGRLATMLVDHYFHPSFLPLLILLCPNT